MSAAAYSRALLREAGAAEVPIREPEEQDCPAADWAQSGALALTGRPDGPPLLPRAAIPTCARGSALALGELASAPNLAALDGPALLGERAALDGLSRRGRISAGGSCRLLEARDGWLAVGLPRGEEDARLLPAWVGIEATGDPWQSIETALARLPVKVALERGRLLGLPIAASSPGGSRYPAPWLSVSRHGERRPGRSRAHQVADLTSLWAGPLCGQLLVGAGLAVSKVESSTRPDGARSGSPQLFRLLNGAKSKQAFDFSTEQGRRALRQYLTSVDIVIESARPRALRQLGIVAEEWLAEAPGRIWCGITGYGRNGPAAEWVALGDDAAAAAGLPFRVAEPEQPQFVGDAIADPLTGLHAAVAILASRERGGGELLDVTLSGVVARAMDHHAAVEGEVVMRPGGWFVDTGSAFAPVCAPRARA